MKKSKRIQAIVDIKAEQTSKALTAVVEQQNKITAAQAQLLHLQQYRQDYIDNDARSGVKRVSTFLEFRAFIAKLDEALETQAATVQQLEQELTRKRQHWESLRHNTQNLQKVCDGLVASELKAADKREQRESDDRSAQASRKNAEGMSNA